jgi:hypothetical protein
MSKAQEAWSVNVALDLRDEAFRQDPMPEPGSA